MTQILKSLLRYKSSTILNIVGLSCAFATFIIISMQIRYDMTYDTHHKNHDSIYELALISKENGEPYGSINRPTIAKTKDNMPEVEYISAMSKIYNIDKMTILGDDERNIVESVITCEKDIAKIFTFEFIEGDESALNDPSNFIVSDEFAKKWYGSQSPIGKSIKCDSVVYNIAAVYKAFPKNETLQGNIFCNMGDEGINDYGDNSFSAFIKFNGEYSKEHIEKNILTAIGKEYYEKKYGTKSIPSAIKLTDIRTIIYGYDNNIIYLMILIAIAIISLASINFINFATSMVPLKIKGINLRKVVGATQNELRVSMIWESITISIISFIFALIIVELFKDSSFSYIIYDLSWEANKLIYLITFGIALLTGTISGLYPALYSTSFQPALVLKSSYALSASGRVFRTALIGFQFFVSLTFIAATIFMQLQYNHLVNIDGGYIKEGIIQVNHGRDYDKHDILKEELLKNHQIKDVAFSFYEFGVDEYGYNIDGVSVVPVSHNFLDFFEIKIDSGRNFIQNDALTTSGRLITGKTTRKEYGLVGETLFGETDMDIGICEDIHVSYMKTRLNSFVFWVQGEKGNDGFQNSYIKVSGNSKEIIDYIKESYKKTDPDVIISVDYLTTKLENAYSDENTHKQIMQAFSLIAIIIALVGVFGLVSFDTKYRRKEIGLRRINGATITNILSMFSTSYVKIMLISFVLSVPLVYYCISQWLEDFPYRIEIYWWVFALALGLVFILTILISATQTISAAKKNPIESLKNE